jgi:hypothetical protein
MTLLDCAVGVIDGDLVVRLARLHDAVVTLEKGGNVITSVDIIDHKGLTEFSLRDTVTLTGDARFQDDGIIAHFVKYLQSTFGEDILIRLHSKERLPVSEWPGLIDLRTGKVIQES